MFEMIKIITSLLTNPTQPLQNVLMGVIKDFLSIDRAPVEAIDLADLQAEVEGWRAIWAILPDGMRDWAIRLGEEFRIVTRRYEAKTGVLRDVKMAVSEYTLDYIDLGFDSVRGVRTVENKTLTIPEAAVMYFEDVHGVKDYEDYDAEMNLAAQSLE